MAGNNSFNIPACNDTDGSFHQAIRELDQNSPYNAYDAVKRRLTQDR